MQKYAELIKVLREGFRKGEFQGGGIFRNWNSLAPIVKDFPDFYTENLATFYQ